MVNNDKFNINVINLAKIVLFSILSSIHSNIFFRRKKWTLTNQKNGPRGPMTENFLLTLQIDCSTITIINH